MANKPNRSLLRRTSRALDGIVEVFSPRKAADRARSRMAYDAIDGSRTRKNRKKYSGTGDKHLTETALSDLREIARDQSRNNPIVKGMLKTETDGVVGSGIKITSATDDDGWNRQIKTLYKELMINAPCDITGKYNINKFYWMMYQSYRRDGDVLALFTDDGPQGIEGDQLGTPIGSFNPKHFDIVNGVAVSKKTQKVVGYYIGKPNKWGFIQTDSIQRYQAEYIHHMFNADRFSQSRGEPAITPSIDAVDKLTDYIDAELVAAKVNACFSMFISRTDEYEDDMDDVTGPDGTAQKTKEGIYYEQLEPGVIMYGEPNETAQGIGQVRPGSLFDPFVLRMLTVIGRPLCMPLMLITLDFSGATFMNTRIAYQKVQESWQFEQNIVLKPFVSRTWRWFVDRMVATGKITAREDMYAHTVQCKRWPYVDPYKEAMADKIGLANGTTNQTIICERLGIDFEDVAIQGGKDKVLLKEHGIFGDDSKQKLSMEDVGRGVRAGVPIGVGEARAAMGLPSETPVINNELLRFNNQDVLNYHVENGILTINEIRQVLGKEPVTWGDVPVRKTGVEIVDADGKKKTETETDDDAKGEKDEK